MKLFQSLFKKKFNPKKSKLKKKNVQVLGGACCQIKIKIKIKLQVFFIKITDTVWGSRSQILSADLK